MLEALCTVGNVRARILLASSELLHPFYGLPFDALTPNGALFVQGDYSYGGRGPRWEALRAALSTRNVHAAILVASRLPTVEVRLDSSRILDPDSGLTISWGYTTYLIAPILKVLP